MLTFQKGRNKINKCIKIIKLVIIFKVINVLAKNRVGKLGTPEVRRMVPNLNRSG